MFERFEKSFIVKVENLWCNKRYVALAHNALKKQKRTQEINVRNITTPKA